MAKVEEDILSSDNIKMNNWALKVMGAYVQEPVPSVVGLDETTVIGSNDAAALYPTGIIYSNIGFDTIRDRVYESFIVKRLIGLIENTYRIKAGNPSAINDAVDGFRNALKTILVDYFKRKSVPNKKDAENFTLEYYPILLKRILSYNGDINDIYNPKDDRTYFLLKSCLYPLLETITWLSPQNRGYNQTTVNYVFFHEDYIKKAPEVFIMREINSTKTTFGLMNSKQTVEHFKTRIVNPYGVLFDKHEDKLAYDVELLIDSLSKRRIIKNQMLVLDAIKEQFAKLSNKSIDFFLNAGKYLNEEQANQILEEINDPAEIRSKRVQSLTEVELEPLKSKEEIEDFLKLRTSQLDITQLGIKVAANSAYGIFGLITWPFASPLIGNAITNAGKIYGIKLFQAVSVDILTKIKNGEDYGN